LSAEAEEPPLLEAVTSERLMKTQQDGKSLACAAEINDDDVITYSSELCVQVVNKSNLQSKTLPIVTLLRDNWCQKWLDWVDQIIGLY
jgi:hypothetical protein